MKFTIWTVMAAVAVSAVACNSDKKKTLTEAPARTVFFDKAGMDTTVSPGENFFLYASGKWMKDTKIPPSEIGWGSFYTLYDDNQKNLRQILEELSKEDNKNGSTAQKVADLYKSGMDTVAMEKQGYEPIKPLLASINKIKDYKQLINLVADGFKDGDGFLFGFYVSADDRNSSKNVARFDQAGLNLPERDYYLSNDSSKVAIRAAYVKYIADMFVNTGEKPDVAAKRATNVLKIETELAKSHSTPVELRNPVKNYNKFSVAELQKQLPDIDLKDVLKRMQINTDTVLVGQPKYYVALNNLLKGQPIDVWKDKLAFNAINHAAPNISKKFRDGYFEFFSKRLYGQQQQRERWKTMVSITDNGLGELLGQLYADKYFTADAKERMLNLVNNLLAVYKERIEKLDWMSPATKEKALKKLSTFTKKIGYPDKWKKYDDVEVDPAAYYANLKSIAKHDYKEMVEKVDKPVDKAEWEMTPPTVNAYYNPSYNEIVFPAGILQFPFFDKNADDAINYGAIGAVIGHEITHGFDDQGSQYDADGNLKNWWTPEDAAKFKSRVQIMIDQYNKYTILDGLHVNGSLTQGENLADIGGLAIAYQAFKNTEQGKSDEKIDGFTPDQRFFLSFAQVWRIKNADETMRVRITTDPHSPEQFRVNGTLSNIPAFFKAFNVKPGDKMYRADKDLVKVW